MSILKCLAEAALIKAERGPLYKKTIADIQNEIQTLKSEMVEGTDMSKELAAAQKVFDTYEHRYTQKVRQVAMHAEKVKEGLGRFTDGVDPGDAVRSFLTSSEKDAYKYADRGALGGSAQEMIRSNQRIFIGLASEILDKLDPKKANYLTDAAKVRELKSDLYSLFRNQGTRSSDHTIRQISEGIQKLTETGGKSFEKAGGNIFLRNDYMLGRSPSLDKIANASRETYIQDGLKAFDLQKIREATGGAIKDVNQLAFALGKDYDAIQSGGLTNLSDFAPPGLKSVVNSRFHRRIFHFIDANADADWHAKYGSDNIYNRIVDYANDIGKDIGLLQSLGPKPDAFIRTMMREGASIAPDTMLKAKSSIMNEFRYVTGQWDKGVDPTISRFMSTQRASQVASKLGFTAIDAVTGDMIALNALASRMRGLPALQSILGSLKKLMTSGLPDDLKELARLGVYTEGFLDDSHAVMKQMEAEGASAFFDKAARAVLKWTGNTRATIAHRAYKSQQIAMELIDFNFDGSNPKLETWLRGTGLTPETLATAKKFGIDKHKQFGLDMVSPVKLFEAGYEKEAAEIASVFNRAVEVFSPMQSDRFKALMANTERSSRGVQILTGQTKLFTGYTSSFFENHVMAILNQPGKMTKAKQLAAYGTVMTLAGVAQQMIRDSLNGKDPELNQSTILKGVSRAGLLPYVTDYLFGSVGSNRNPAEVVLGPIGQNIETALVAAGSAIKGEGTKALRSTQKLIEEYLPGKNAWYSALILQRLMLDNIKLLYDPNAHKNFKAKSSRLKREGQEYWWKPGESSPERAPDLNPLDKTFEPEPTKGR